MFMYKTWSNPQLKNHKKAMNSDQSDHRHNTKIQDTRILQFLTPLTPSVEKTVNLYGFTVSL